MKFAVCNRFAGGGRMFHRLMPEMVEKIALIIR